MNYTNEQIEALRGEVEKRMSKKRFLHTLGVENMAVKIGLRCLPDRLDELRVAALLHDISKEYSKAEHNLVVIKHKINMSEYEKEAEPVWHSVTAPYVILDLFAPFASSDVLSAVKYHTVGSPEMSVFDEIICLADYIEEGRKYQVCIDLREKFLCELDRSRSREEAVYALHKACAKSIDNTIKDLVSRGLSAHPDSLPARDAILAKTERH